MGNLLWLPNDPLFYLHHAVRDVSSATSTNELTQSLSTWTAFGRNGKSFAQKMLWHSAGGSLKMLTTTTFTLSVPLLRQTFRRCFQQKVSPLLFASPTWCQPRQGISAINVYGSINSQWPKARAICRIFWTTSYPCIHRNSHSRPVYISIP
jgi:hypothetical protein